MSTAPPFSTDALVALRAAFRGPLLTPGDPGYDAARVVWNARIDRRPALIARCTGVADVVAAVRFARAHDVRVAVRSGGHDVAGNGVCDGGVVLDLSPMKGVRVDPARRTVRAQTGLTWAELDRETQVFGLATTGGQCSATGVAGVALGGGLGWLMRQHGLTIDNLLSVDLVTADGAVLTASADEHPELFWGLRGGGGNFGVVTSLELRLHPVADVTVAMFFHPADRFVAAARALQDYAAGAPDPLSAAFIYMDLPPLPQVPAHLHGQPGVILAAIYNGPLAEAEPLVAPLRGFGPPLGELVAPMPYTVLQGMFDAAPAGAYGYGQSIRSSYFGAVDDAALADIAAQVRRAPSATCNFELVHLEGAVARVSEEATAYPRRDARFFGMFQATWKDPADAERHMQWTDSAWRAIEAHTLRATYPNFIDDDPGDRVAESFGSAKMARLTALKRAHDPDNFFRMNKNIRP